jgi:hypothetical protein
MKEDESQTINQIRLLNQNNALKNNNKMAKWKGLDKLKKYARYYVTEFVTM